jgi:2-polyprenyl-3-methyl-5-hydroxy-6-metoxy-1,4-benzoquinol methylase
MKRSDEPELMDLPDGDPVLLGRTIQQFAAINRLVSASRRLIGRYLLSRIEPNRHYTLLDAGAGGADIDVWILEAFRRRGSRVHITAVDHDARVIAAAKKQVGHLSDISLVHADLADIGQWGTFDFIFSNHLMHHLDDEAAAALLHATVRQHRIAFLMNDIDRNLVAYAGYALVCGLLFRRSLSLHDGLLSVRRSMTCKEWRTILARNGLDDRIMVVPAFPFRVALVGRA